jgi:prolyl oligopeptidase
MIYPETRRDTTIVDNHGLTDPYRWLEDADSAETKAWIKSQNQLTHSYIHEYHDRAQIQQRLTEIYNYPKMGCPFKKGEYYYFSRNDGLQNQDVIYRSKVLGQDVEVFFDPNQLSTDGTVCLGESSFSETGRYFAYTLGVGGSDWRTGYVMDTQTGEKLADKVQWMKFTGIAWTHDDRGFFYNRYQSPESVSEDQAGTENDANLNQKVYYHIVGTSQDQDMLIYETPSDPELLFETQVSHDGQYLMLIVVRGCEEKNQFHLAKLAGFSGENKLDFTTLISDFEAKYSYVHNLGSQFYLETNLNAPKNKIVCVDVASQPFTWTSIIEESVGVLTDITVVDHNKLVLVYNHDVRDQMGIYALATGEKLQDLSLPTFGSAYAVGDWNQSEFFYHFSSFLHPGTIFRYDFKTGLSTIFDEIKVKGFDPSQYETQQVFYPSLDGTKVPMFIVMKKGSLESGPKPLNLYGYGGFNVSYKPGFSPFRVVLMGNLGINIAIANIRGGGEYGEQWHDAGKKTSKQTCFNDFQAGAEYLIKNGYTSPSQLAINGGSNGGLLVGACLNQRPDLYGCVVGDVGVFDMLRFQMFTIGRAWATEYGCAENPEEFDYLIKYSPLHNVPMYEAGKHYPAVLLTTGDHDDRVVPLHSYKFISQLQSQLGASTNPMMIRVDENTGHGAGTPTAKIIEEVTDIYSFMAHVFKLKFTSQ